VAAQCLQKLPSSNNKFTYNCDGHTFNYLVDSGFSNSLNYFSFVDLHLFYDFDSCFCILRFEFTLHFTLWSVNSKLLCI
jgi:hypothetical protein